MYLLCSLIALAVGFVLDLLLGDPEWLPHPIRLIGWLIAKLERGLRRLFPKSPRGELWGGVCLVGIVTLLSTAVPLGILVLAYWLHWMAGIVVESIFCYQLLAMRCLQKESMAVARVLKTGNLAAARKQVGRIVGRDTDRLDCAGVTRAAVETVAENTSDGVIAPMLFLAIGGAPLGFFYKAVNTMDSMVGYRNDQYLHFGRAAARLDDVLNFIPARLSAVLMIVSAFLLGFDGRNAFRIWRRDRHNHKSPNSAQTESVCAGALQIQLAGDAWYFGELHQKPTIGASIRPVRVGDIQRANGLLFSTAVLCLLLVIAVKLPLAILFW